MGLVATAVAGLAAGIYGVIKADEQLRAEALKKDFYDGVGTSISDIAAGFGNITQAVMDANQPIIDNQPSSTTPKKASKKPHLRSTD